MSSEDGHNRSSSPSADQITSAAAAMLKLSSSVPQTKSPIYVMNETPVTSPSSVGSLSPGRNSVSQLSPAGEYSMGQRATRKQREFIPEYRKDDQYWIKRRKNNEAAKRSREKRRSNDMVMSQTIMQLNQENKKLQQELDAIKRQFGLPVDQQFPHDEDDTGELSQQSSGPENTGRETYHLEQEPRMTGEPPVLIPKNMPALSPIAGVARLPSAVAQPCIAPRLITPSGPPGLAPDPQSHIHSAAQRHTAATSGLCPVLPQGGQVPPRVTAPGYVGYQLPLTATSWSNGKDTQQPAYLGRPHSPQAQPLSPDRDSNDSPQSLKISFSAGASSSSDVSDNETSRNTATKKHYSGCASNVPNDRNPEPFIEKKSRSMARKGMPVKLRHKITSVENENAQEEWDCETHQPHVSDELNGDNSDLYSQYPYGASLAHRSSSNTSSDDANSTASNSGGKTLDPKYLERRKRNNMAARKCRENRKVLTDMRIAKANILESENTQLKEELRSLSTEICSLKEMLDKKKKALAKGETFELPPLDCLQEGPSSKGSAQDPTSSG